jgi:bifunctional non-homologous end joining protein LigD
MLAVLANAPLVDSRLVYERKYDGIRAVIEVASAKVAPAVGKAARARVRIASRLGNDKTAQFPEVVASLDTWARANPAAVAGGALILDGEIVALDDAGAPQGFQRIQDRIHLTGASDVVRLASRHPVAYVVFDLLFRDGRDLRALPLVERRMQLEQLFADTGARPDRLRLSEIAVGDGTAIYERALADGWEGLIAKDGASRYRSGERASEWRKIKLVKRQEMIVGGWTEPRRSRAKLGALLLGLREPAGLRYAGHVGSGFTEKDLERIGKKLAEREIDACPFTAVPPANERPHWVRPDLVAEVQFSGWTDDGIARHAVFLGLRDDVAPATVVREDEREDHREDAPSLEAASPAGAELASLLSALEEIEASKARGGGTVDLPGGISLEVSNLNKRLWPLLGITKGQLLRYYVVVAPYLLPVLEDRPLVMRRFPDGVDGPAFYQQRAPDKVPRGIRVERVAADKEVPTRLIGGSLSTLLYMTQLASISQDPWFSRAQSPDDIDFAAIDLDPLEGTPFATVRDVARWTHDQLDALGIEGFVKTSGASGMHIYVPMPPGTPYESGMLFCQIVATLVAAKHPRAATVERAVDRRPAGTVYIDYLQNIRGKTIACAYSARASAFAGASTPLRWTEIGERLDPRDFTIATLPARLRTVGDLWAELRRSRGVDLEAAIERAQTKHGKAPR